MRSAVISIGYELLQGRVVNSNAAYISRRLTLLGIEVVLHMSVGDSFDDIARALDTAFKVFNVDIVVTTGGLGPTYDDITSEALSRYFGEEHVVNEEALREIRSKYEKRGMELTPERIKMAYMPRSATPLPNPVGIAPGILLVKDNKIVVSLPGVPSEMEAIWESSVERFLRRYSRRVVAETMVRLVGVPESSLAREINRFVREHPEVYVKTHPSGHETRGPVNDLYIMVSVERGSDAPEICRRTCLELLDMLRRSFPGLVIEGECGCNSSA